MKRSQANKSGDRQKWTRNFGLRYKVDSAQMRGPYDDGKTTECFLHR